MKGFLFLQLLTSLHESYDGIKQLCFKWKIDTRFDRLIRPPDNNLTWEKIREMNMSAYNHIFVCTEHMLPLRLSKPCQPKKEPRNFMKRSH